MRRPMSPMQEFVIAITDYDADSQEELSCRINDVLRIIHKEGRRNIVAENMVTGVTGFLPTYCVKDICVPKDFMHLPLFVATEDYCGTESGTLRLHKGDVIIGDRRLDSNWWLGWIGSEHGLFPLMCTIPLRANEKSKDQTKSEEIYFPESSSGVPCPEEISDSVPHAWTLYQFQSDIPGELSFRPNSLIYLTGTVGNPVDPNWLEGRTEDGKSGIFPRNFVEVIVDLPERKTDQNATVELESTQEDFPPDTYAIVACDSSKLDKGFLHVSSGDTITLLRKIDNNHVEAMDDFGNVGLVDVTNIEIIGSEPEEVRSVSGGSLFSRGSVDSLRSSGNSLGSGYSGSIADQQSSWKEPQATEWSSGDYREDSGIMVRPASAVSSVRSIGSLSKRQNVINEIISTENDYGTSIRVLLTELTSGNAPPEFNTKAVLSNLASVAELSEYLVRDLRLAGDQIGECFVRYLPSVRDVYMPFCEASDAGVMLLFKYKDNEKLAEYMKGRVEAIRGKVNCFDLPSMLIKPVQRVLKYPLLMSELLKVTEISHPDHIYTRDALKAVTDLASDLNEVKRRKELVAKYRDESKSLSDRLARLSVHSLVKKSNRIGMILSASMGLTTLAQDPTYRAEERKFQVNKRAIKRFLHNVKEYIEHVEELGSRLQSVASSFALLLPESDFASQFCRANENSCSYLLHDTVLKISSQVVAPLEQLLSRFQGPSNLMAKRHAKLIDYENAKRKAEKMKDAQRTPAVKEELELAKKVYLALNAQLLDDLPKFNLLALQILNGRIAAFQEVRRSFASYCSSNIASSLATVPNRTKDFDRHLASKVSNVLNSLKSLDDVNLESVSVPSAPRRSQSTIAMPTIKELRTDRCLSQIQLQRAESSASLTSSSYQAPEVVPKGSSLQRSMTISAPALKRYVIVQDYRAQAQFELTVKRNEIVEVIKDKDPSGDTSRWFVKLNGQQGFVPRRILSAQAQDLPNSPASASRSMSVSSMPTAFPTYVAAFDFTPLGPYQMQLKKGETLRVIAKHDLDGNTEWWYVEKASDSARGYVPSSYLSGDRSVLI